MSIEQLVFLIEQLNEPIIVIDQQLSIVCYNKQSQEWFQYKPEEAIGQSINILIPFSLHSAHNQHAKKFMADNAAPRRMISRNSAIYGRRKDGYEFPISVSISNMQLNDQQCAIAIIDLPQQ
ncbi:PAS domain S-box protein [Zooshikella marina]|uniref:PAS domain S-box protein n=1 Tax=Zooshikella ganghwensis TaxID=202772 RepID=UPI001BAF9285|nr:PAS domain S-box protein [Zooshikella ganghwensis]MBU2705984.1 PAS domain S-box protein [Zooshikella ganghwensis]